MISTESYNEFFEQLILSAGDRERIDLTEAVIIGLLEKILSDRTQALESWELISGELRKRVVRNGYVLHWDMIRRVVKISKLPTSEELENACEIYQITTPKELERRIQSLTGIEFETFLAAILGRLPDFRNIVTTRQSHDGGVDFKGHYVPSLTGPQFILIGQAKRVVAAVTASQARDFLGALDTSRARGVVGLFASTAGFTEPAIEALDSSSFTVMRWGMHELIERSREMMTRKIELKFSVPDDTFWGEVIGRA